MSRLSDSHHFRKTVAGVCMIGAPLLLVIGMIVHPETKSDVGDQLAVISANMDDWYAAHLIVAVALVLAVPAVLGLMHMLRDREVAYGHSVAAWPWSACSPRRGSSRSRASSAGRPALQAAADAAAMTALFERVTETSGVVLPIFVMSYAFTVGMLFLAAGLYRARAVQSWTAAMLGIGPIVLAVGSAMTEDVVSIVGAGILLVGFFQVGRMVLTESDEDWEHTPEYHGFRPLAGTR